MSSPHHYAKSRLEFIPQRFNPWVLRLTQFLIPFLLRFRLRKWLPAGIAQVEVVNGEQLIQIYQQFQAGKIRFLIAFRHPEVDDPLCMFYLLSRVLPRLARQQRMAVQLPLHSHFVYDRGMTIWAGDWLGWFFSRLGGIPIHRGKSLDRTGIRAARDLFMNGKFPIAVAPEGATNGHSEIVSMLEPGVAQMGFWCAEDLAKADRPEQVWIVPIGIQYHYLQPPWAQIDRLLNQLEADNGLAAEAIEPVGDAEGERYQRLLRIADHLLTKMEQFYHRFYHQPIPQPEVSSTELAEVLLARLQILLDIALRVSEQFFGLPAQGNVIERCRRLEEAGWNAIYREDIPDLATISNTDRGLADWVAEEAEVRLRHMRLVESFVAVADPYLPAQLSAERFAEIALLMFDVTARLKGDRIPCRPRLGWRRARLTIGEPISVSDRWLVYEQNRAASKQAVKDLTQELQQILEKLIHE